MSQSKGLLIVVVLIMVSTPTLAAIKYNIISLGANDDWNHTPYWVNDRGLIVGQISSSAVLFDLSGEGNSVKLSESYSCARSINNAGMIVGYGVGKSGTMQAMSFDASGNGKTTTLGLGHDVYGARANAINNSNQIVGGSGNGEGCKAWLYDTSGTQNNKYLGQGEATSISDNGTIVGDSHPIQGDGWHATIFDATGGGNNIDLGKLFISDDRSFAKSINTHNQIVGSSGGPGSYTATLYDPTGSANNIALGIIGDSYASAINNHSQIVGQEGGYATLFDITGSGQNINLNDLIDPSLGWTLTNANHINDKGMIVGTGNQGVYLLTPTTIPTPSSILLLVYSLPFIRIMKRKPLFNELT